jgi:hypothetical protein
MGLFDWLRGSKAKVQIAEYRIWLTKQAKFAGVQREIAQAVADPGGPDVVFVVAHFPDCLDELQRLIAGAQFDGGRVLTTSSEALEGATAGAAFSESRRVLIVVGERHPLPSHDEALVEFARRLPCQCRLVQHVSLEDPLVKTIAGPWVQGLLRQLGMKEDEPIESRMVGHRIRTAQAEIAKRATGDAPASSAEAWIEKNCPQ